LYRSCVSCPSSLTCIHWFCYCTGHVYLVLHHCDIKWSFWAEATLCLLCIVRLYLCCRWRSNNQEGRVGIPSTGLNLQHFVPIQGRISNVICRGIFMVNYILYKNAGFWLVNSRDIFFANSGLALWICRIFTSCRCICIRFNFFSWYLQNRICRFYPSPRRL
jgi:hypothetical protein